MQRVLNEFDTFKLSMKDNFENVDHQTIFMLYQPIIGVNATSLYLTLLQEKQLTNRVNLDFNHTRLMLILNIDKLDLLEAFNILETYNLINTYYYPGKSTYIYDLIRPLSTELFFQNEKLRTKLLENLGSLHYERQKYYFFKSEPVITEDFINVSALKYNEETLNNSQNSLQQLLHNLNKPKLAINDLAQKLMSSNHNNYNYQAQSNLDNETSIIINQNKELFHHTLGQMQLQKPEDYLFTLTKKPIDQKLKTIINLLVEKYQLTDGVINCLFEYVWFKNAKRIEPNYILKIAKTFQDNTISDVSSALKHLKLAYSKSKKHTYTIQNNYQQDTLWTKDDFNFEFSASDDFKNPINNGTMTTEEIQKILKEFDNH